MPPLFLVEGIQRRLGDLRERRVAVLGLAFKGDTDESEVAALSARWVASGVRGRLHALVAHW